MSFLDNNPPFQSVVRASGLAEVWTHSTDAVKFNQFGWRCTNKETSYGNDTLVGNWNEERFDNKISKNAKPLPSQVCIGLSTNVQSGGGGGGWRERGEGRPWCSCYLVRLNLNI